MKKRLLMFSILISILLFNFSITDVFATIAIEVKVGGEAITYNMNTNEYNTNSAGTIKYEYNANYGAFVLKLNNYNGGLIEVNCRSGSPTQTCSKETIFIIEVTGDNYINSNDLAISSNIDIKVIGNGNLTVNADSLKTDNININVEESVKLTNNTKDNKEENNNIEKDNTEKNDSKVNENNKDKEDSIDIKELLMILAIVLNIILSGTILIVLTTKLIKQK